MYSDLFEQIDAARNGRRAGRPGNSGTDAAAAAEPPPLVSFKAGKMKMVQQPPTSATTGSTNDDNNTGTNLGYHCEADTSRGEVRMVWNTSLGKVQWQWYDRRIKKVIDEYTITEAGSTFERIDLYKTSKKHKSDRIYVWSKKDTTSTIPVLDGASVNMKYEIYWMQDISDEKDDEIVAQVNQYLADPDSAAPEGTTLPVATTTTAASGTGSSSSRSTTTAGGTTAAVPSSSQVDALSSILENLGMPQGDITTSSTAPSTAASGTGTQMLTLADLQGAMAGIQAASSSQQGATAGPPLTDVVHSPEAITAILESDVSVQERLIQLLPEGQQTIEHLNENLRSPQVQQTLRTLTQALLPDENGDLTGYASIIANFQFDPSDGQQTLSTTGNPIQAFLDCIIKSVENDNTNEENATNNNDNDGATDGDNDVEIPDADNDTAPTSDDNNTNEETKE